MRVSSSPRLHPTAAAVYRFIIRFKRQTGGDSPTRREIMAGVGIPSTSLVQHHLMSLEAAGLITRPSRGDARRIGVPGATWVFDEVGGQQKESPGGSRDGQNICALCDDERAAEFAERREKDGGKVG